MRWIVDSSLRFRRVVAVTAVVFVLVGAWQVRRLSVDSLPEFSPTTVEVQTEALGLSSTEIEQLITVPLEQDLLNGVAHLALIRSSSVPGLSSVEMIFEPGTTLYQARQVVQERLTQAHALPNVSKPPAMLQPRSSTSRVMMVALSSKTLSLIEMSRLARWTIRPRLMGVPGVSGVSMWGHRERQLQVQVDPQHLAGAGVALEQVIRATGNATFVSPLTFLEASTPGTGGFIDTNNQRLGIQHLLPIHTAADLADITLDERGEGVGLRLGDVATVVEDHQPLIGDAASADGAGLMLVIDRIPGANTRDVTRRVDEALDSLRPGLGGLSFDTSVFRPATYIDSAMHTGRVSLLAGFVLLVGFLVVAFRGWRKAAVCVVAVSASLVAAALVLVVRGTTANMMVLAGLALAVVIVVDDAVAFTDHVVRRLRQTDDGGLRPDPALVVREAVVDIGGSTVFATLIIAVAAIPLLLLHSLSFGDFLAPTARSYLLAVAVSALVALAVTPALSLVLVSAAPVGVSEPLAGGWLLRRHQGLLRRVASGWMPLAAAAALAVLAVALLPRLDVSLVPALEDPDVLIHLDSVPGTSLAETGRITSRAARELQSVRGVRHVGAHVGRAILGDQVVGANSAELWVRLKSTADHQAAIAEIRRVVRGYPGLRGDVLAYPKDRIQRVLERTDKPVVVRIFGIDQGVLNAKAEELRRSLTAVQGIDGARVEARPEEPTIQVEVDLDAAQRAGIKPGDVRRASATLLSGIEVGSLFEDQKVYEVVVRGVPATRQNLTSVRDMLIETPSGSRVRLGDVAKVNVAAVPAVIRHEGSSRSVDVTADVRGRSLGAVVADVRQRLNAVQMPLEYHGEVLGGYAHHRAVVQRGMLYAVVAAVGILLLFQAAFESWRLAVLAFVSLPLALVGGGLAILADGGTLTLGALVGAFAVLGLAARHITILLRRYQEMETRELEPMGVAMVVRGAGERVAPVLTAAGAIAIAFVPVLLRSGVPGHEIVRPMALMVVGGLVTSSVVTLLLTPALYLRLAMGRADAAPTEPRRRSLRPRRLSQEANQ